MKEFKTGAVRDVGGKGRMDLLPMCALLRVSHHMENSISPDPETSKPHYEERNWENGIPMHSMVDSAMRHLAKYIDGQTDEDHLCAAATNLLMAMWTEEKLPSMQDIPSRIAVGVEPPIASECDCWKPTSTGEGRCWGTRERDLCNCGGNTKQCDFYPSKRNEKP